MSSYKGSRFDHFDVGAREERPGPVAEIDLEDAHLGLRFQRHQLGGEGRDPTDPAEVGLADNPDRVPRLEPFFHRALAAVARYRLLESRRHDLRPEHPRSDLRRPAHGNAPSLARPQKLEGPAGHRNRAEALRDDQRDSDLLRAGNGDAQVVSQELPQIVIVESADDHRLDPVRDRLPTDRAGHVGPAGEDLAAARLADRTSVKGLARAWRTHVELPARLPADAEDSLDEGALRPHRHARFGMNFGDRPVDIRVHLDGNRLLT